jgi:diguanylate cyclase (GGDEF)-like protein
MAFMAGGLVFQWLALRGWLGPRPGGRLMLALAVLMPVGYAIGFQSYPFRVGWANFLLTAQMCLICLALAWPAPQASPRWRALLGVCVAVMAGLTLWRGVLGAFFTASYPFFRAPHPVNLANALMHNVTVVLGTLGMLVAWREEAERELRRLASTDGLTGLLNRRAFTVGVDRAIAAMRRYPHALTMMLIDRDEFKQVNDEHGHAKGDQALQLAASVMQAECRSGDLIGRYGGEEFCILLSHASVDEARAFDTRLRQALADATERQLGFALNFSAGLAAWQASDADLDAWLRRADQAMYQAKHAGRGQLAVV